MPNGLVSEMLAIIAFHKSVPSNPQAKWFSNSAWRARFTLMADPRNKTTVADSFSGPEVARHIGGVWRVRSTGGIALILEGTIRTFVQPV
jgi:hypothetical protein